MTTTKNSNAIERAPRGELTGTYDADAANKRLAHAAQKFNLVSPATSVGALPEGCGVAISRQDVDVENDTYDVGGGKRGLSKTVLQKLAAALGVSWDPQGSGRLDDGSHPHYCRWRSVGYYRAFDGQVQIITAEKEMDLRDGSAQVEALWARYEAKKDKGAKSPEGQIREMRLHIQAHAETKAQLRAIRSLGIKTAYTRAELAKPFIAARVMFTGETDDPELRREFARMSATAFLGGTRALYGQSSRERAEPSAAAAPAALPVAATPPKGFTAPPPVTQSRVEPDDYVVDDDERYGAGAREREAEPEDDGGSWLDDNGEPAPASSGQLPAQASGIVLRFSKSKGKTVEQAATDDLTWIERTVAGNLETGESKYPDSDRKLLNAVRAELSRRDGAGDAY